MDAEGDRRSDDFPSERQGGHNGPGSESAVIGAPGDAAPDIILHPALDAVQLEWGGAGTLARSKASAVFAIAVETMRVFNSVTLLDAGGADCFRNSRFPCCA